MCMYIAYIDNLPPAACINDKINSKVNSKKKKKKTHTYTHIQVHEHQIRIFTVKTKHSTNRNE